MNGLDTSYMLNGKMDGVYHPNIIMLHL